MISKQSTISSIIRVVLVLNIFLSFPLFMKAKDTEPDFAYPKEVSAQAEAQLSKALANGDGQSTVDALIKFGLAQTSISSSNFPDVVGKVTYIIGKEKNPVTRSLLNLLLADMYKAYYENNRWNINNRTTLDGETDFTLWSGQQFKDRITQLTDAALSDSAALVAARVADYPTVILSDPDSQIFFPTLYDFACSKSISMLASISQTVAVLPVRALYTTFILPTTLGRENRTIISIADRWIDANRSSEAPLIKAITTRFLYVKRLIADETEGQTADMALKLYREHLANPYAIELLLTLSTNELTEEQRSTLYNIYRDFAAAHPDYILINGVRNQIEELSQRSSTISTYSQVAKGVPFKIKVSATNMNEVNVDIYRIKENFSSTRITKDALIPTPYAKLKAKFAETVPFTAEAEIEAVINDYGRYIAITSFDDLDRNFYNDIVCSDLAVISNSLFKDMMAWVLNPVSGHPVKGADVTIQYNGKPVKESAKLVTDADGAVKIPYQSNYFDIRATKGADRFGKSDGTSFHNYYNSKPSHTAFIRTDLPIYHPGDSASIVAIAYNYLNGVRLPDKQMDCRLLVRDANNQVIDTLDLKTDDFGRVAASVRLPKEGLTGYYSIIAQTDGQFIGSQRFMVSDYKLPTYEVTLDKPSAANDSVIISGRAMTYSGFPVQNAKVAVKLSGFTGFFWGRTSEIEFYTDTIATADDGRFELAVTPEILAMSPFPEGFISADITVTSPSGENRLADTSFSIGKKYSIMASVYGTLNAVSDARINVSVRNFINEPVNSPVKFIFSRAGKSFSFDSEAAGSFAAVDLSSLHSGTYTLKIEAPETDAEPVTIGSVEVYNASDVNSPSDDPLWVLNNNIDLTAGKRRAEIVYGINGTDVRVLLTVSTSERVVERRWLRPTEGINRLAIEMPKDAKNASVNLTTIRNFSTYNETIALNLISPSDQLKVKIERIRDRVTPLSDETITVSVTDGSGKGIQSALILDMYSKALNAIEEQSWRFNPTSGYRPSLSSSYYYPGNYRLYTSARIPWLEVPAITAPDFNLYGRGFFYNYDNIYYSTTGVGAAMPGMQIRGSMKMQAPALRENSAMKAEATMAMADVAEDADEGLALEETVVASSSQAADGKNDSQIRPSEIALGFFAPMLNTDADGNLTYSFTVPNANTTWALYALAYNNDMLADLVTAEIISSKPVMVEPNMPRFVRTGDRADIRASVMNATDSAKSVVTTFEILNPADMSVIRCDRVNSEIPAGGSKIVTFPLIVEAETQNLFIRIKTTDGEYTDGVQTILPVLASSQPVLDSETFYLPVDSLDFSMPVPASKEEDATTIVSFCENPTWEVVSALPGLRADEKSTSLAASAKIFSAAVAGYVMNLNPAVEQGLKQWLESAKDEGTLLSMLNRNEDLKQLTLSSTPWMQQAESDNERLTRLALLFDRNEISGAIASGADALEMLQTSNGGFCWTANYREPSEWVTIQILNNFAELRQLGCFPERLEPMMKKAWNYIDSEVAKDYAKYPSSDFFFYTYVRSLYPEINMTTGATKAFNATVKAVRKNWKSYGTAKKAAAALILYRTGNPEEAAKVLKSLREFATVSPQLGMWWDSVDDSTWWSLYRTGQTAFILEAFNTIEPGCADIDRIRQWLVLNKVVQDWGTSVNASACVAAILRCGSNWLYKPGNVEIAVGGKQLKPTNVDSLTGAFHLTVENPSGDLTIRRSNESPAWGAVMTRSTQVMTDIEAHSLPELSIEKQILVNEGGKWVDADSLRIGQTAKIRLIVNSMRDMDYVTVVDNRAATMEPVVQTPRPVYCDGVVFYLENRDAATNLFISRLARGQYIIEYEMFVNNAGVYSSGIATIQSQYTPEMTAHSAGRQLHVSAE